jgi:hypothetical protein
MLSKSLGYSPESDGFKGRWMPCHGAPARDKLSQPTTPV